jgi:hypothetical protein
MNLKNLSIEKPCKWIEPPFVQQLKMIIHHMNLMTFNTAARTAPTIMPVQLRNTVFNAVPTTWQQLYLHVRTVDNTTLLSIQNFLEVE